VFGFIFDLIPISSSRTALAHSSVPNHRPSSIFLFIQPAASHLAALFCLDIFCHSFLILWFPLSLSARLIFSSQYTRVIYNYYPLLPAISDSYHVPPAHDISIAMFFICMIPMLYSVESIMFCCPLRTTYGLVFSPMPPNFSSQLHSST
jgi:hypothetical protein